MLFGLTVLRSRMEWGMENGKPKNNNRKILSENCWMPQRSLSVCRFKKQDI